MRVSSREMRSRLSELLDAVEKGHRVTITRRGVEIAVLEPTSKKITAEFLDELRAISAAHPSRGEPASETVVKARREERT